WLTLIDPPLPVSHKWLRTSGLDPQRILIIRPKHGMDTLELCCEILRLGYSHTVVSWLPPRASTHRRLEAAARAGYCARLNVRLGSAGLAWRGSPAGCSFEGQCRTRCSASSRSGSSSMIWPAICMPVLIIALATST